MDGGPAPPDRIHPDAGEVRPGARVRPVYVDGETTSIDVVVEGVLVVGHGGRLDAPAGDVDLLEEAGPDEAATHVDRGHVDRDVAGGLQVGDLGRVRSVV